MRWIKKGKEPKQLTEFRNSGGTWEEFSLERGKKEVKQQLLSEQHNLCAYCTGAIRFENMKVEHWCPRKICTNRHLDYSNLLAVCKGCYNYGKYLHCDTSKAHTLIELNPTVQNHVDTISYTKNTGKILSSNEQFQKEMDSILNLNIAPLTKARKRLLTDFRLRLNKKNKGKTANYQKLLKIWEAKNTPHSRIIVWYLKNKIK